MNPNLAAQGARGRENMMPPTSVMDERYPAFKRNQEDAEKLMLGLDIVGSAIPLAGPAMKGAKILGQAAAPQIAQALENYTFKTGMALPVIDTTGLPNKGKDLIRSKADELADTLNKQGFQATAEYSGSAAGPSAYVNVFDPQTGRFITSPARISGHSKGAYQSQFVHEISDDPQSTQRFVNLAMEMRAKGPTELMQKQGEAEKAAMQMRYESAQKKIAKGKSLTNSEQEAVTSIERQAGRTFAAPGDEALRLAQERDNTKNIISGIGDELITLYHGTSKSSAKKIKDEGVIKSGSYFGNINGVSLTPRKSVAEDFANGGEIIEVKVPKSKLVVDPESVDNFDLDDAIRNGNSVFATGNIYFK